ncbi:Uncharacterised protein [Segatella copri]|nr:Uncharacterised protein [Segatella copri]
MFYHNHRIAQLLQFFQHLNQSGSIAAMESDTRFVEDIYATHER